MQGFGKIFICDSRSAEDTQAAKAIHSVDIDRKME